MFCFLHSNDKTGAMTQIRKEYDEWRIRNHIAVEHGAEDRSIAPCVLLCSDTHRMKKSALYLMLCGINRSRQQVLRMLANISEFFERFNTGANRLPKTTFYSLSHFINTITRGF